MRKHNSSGPSRGKRGASRQSRHSGKSTDSRKPGFSSSPSKRSDDDSSEKKKRFPKGPSLGKFHKRPSSAEGKFDKKGDHVERKKRFSKPGESKTPGKPGSVHQRAEKSSGFFGKQSFKRGKSSYKPKKEEAPTIANQTGKIRLNRYIANSGVCSRREADELIKMGLVAVNGRVITEMGYQVNPGDEVRYENRLLKAEKPVYILMNKPKGYLTTTKDPQERNTVMNIIGGAVKERVYPVGRLDRNTTGLLLFTNDGALADKLSHPSYNVKKIYKVELDRPLTKNDFQKILEGVRLEEGRAVVDDLAIVSDDGKTVGIELHIGWNRVVRRIFETLGYEVARLDRSVYAGLDKKDLPRGHWRFLTKEEVVRLKHYK
jgi:23S rRNA pseudouridine2605 synthase